MQRTLNSRRAYFQADGREFLNEFYAGDIGVILDKPPQGLLVGGPKLAVSVSTHRVGHQGVVAAMPLQPPVHGRLSDLEERSDFSVSDASSEVTPHNTLSKVN